MRNIMCFGDSNTFGFVPGPEGRGSRFAPDVRWPGALQNLLGEGWHIIEEGCNSRTSVFDDPYYPWRRGLDYLPAALMSHRPLDAVVINLGANDLKSVFHATADDIAHGVEMLVKCVRTCPIEPYEAPQVLIVSPSYVLPEVVFDFSGYTADAVETSHRLAPLYKQVADAQGCGFVDAGPICQVSTVDGLHMTAQGHAALAQAVADELRRMLGA